MVNALKSAETIEASLGRSLAQPQEKQPRKRKRWKRVPITRTIRRRFYLRTTVWRRAGPGFNPGSLISDPP
jgi:hypothetical protein